MKKVSDIFKSIRFAKMDPKHEKGHKGPSEDDEEHGAVSSQEFAQQVAHVKKRSMQESEQEDLTELKKDTVQSYLDKAKTNYATQRKRMSRSYYKDVDKYDDASIKSDARKAGIKSAKAKLANEEVVAESAPIVIAQAPISVRNSQKKTQQEKPLTAYQKGIAAQGKPYKNPHPFDPKAGADVNYDHNQYRSGYNKTIKEEVIVITLINSVQRQVESMRTIGTPLHESRKTEIVKEIMQKKKNEKNSKTSADKFEAQPVLTSEISKE